MPDGRARRTPERATAATSWAAEVGRVQGIAIRDVANSRRPRSPRHRPRDTDFGRHRRPHDRVSMSTFISTIPRPLVRVEVLKQGACEARDPSTTVEAHCPQRGLERGDPLPRLGRCRQPLEVGERADHGELDLDREAAVGGRETERLKGRKAPRVPAGGPDRAPRPRASAGPRAARESWLRGPSPRRDGSGQTARARIQSARRRGP